MKSPPVIFIATVDGEFDEANHPFSPSQEAKALDKALGHAVENGLCEVIYRDNVSLKDVINIFQDSLYRERIAVFHFVGPANSYFEVLEKPYRNEYPQHPKGFPGFLGEQANLKLTFLSGCAKSQHISMFSKQGIPLLVANQGSTPKKTIFEQTIQFYHTLGEGQTFAYSI